ncbi:gliding motility protein GldF [Pseudomonas sp. R5-89-07]|nr:gliding motility protein GldF [Pseudomonas sp. R5-89-07]
MTPIFVIFKRELCGYFVSPLAYIFIEVFLVLSGVLTFYVGGFFERNQADLVSFLVSIRGCIYFWLLRSLCAFGLKSDSPETSNYCSRYR